MTEVDTSRERLERLQSIGCADYLHMALLDALDAERAENERLRGLVSDSEKMRYRTCSDLLTRAEKAEKENERLREALKPFAEAAEYTQSEVANNYSPSWAEFFTFGDFRRARAALNQEGGE